MKSIRPALFATFFSLCFTQAALAATEKVTVGSIVKLVPKETEIYVMSEGTKYEYYFNKDTKVIGADKSEKKFADLAEGMKVRVTAQQTGKRLDPVQVEIID